MPEKKNLEFIANEGFLMKALNDVCYEYEPQMPKKEYYKTRDEIAEFIDKYGSKIDLGEMMIFKNYCKVQFDKYFEKDKGIK